MREQKISVTIFGVCTIVVAVLATMNVRAQVVGPFLVSKSVLEKSKQLLAKNPEGLDPQSEALKQKDTDRDGLSDYDELNAYQTSPYLPDTDSDGIPDAVELAQGTNPNCPQGKSCLEVSNDVPRTGTSTLEEFITTPVPTVGSALVQGAASSVAGAQQFIDAPPPPESMTADQIRAFLVSHNLISAEQLAPLPDDHIIAIYKAAYQEALNVQAAYKNPISTATIREDAPVDLIKDDE